MKEEVMIMKVRHLLLLALSAVFLFSVSQQAIASFKDSNGNQLFIPNAK